MKKSLMLYTMLIGATPLFAADTNALIEVKLFKTWITKEEVNFGKLNLAIKNTGEKPILLAKHPVDFECGQLAARPFPHQSAPFEDEKQEREYRMTVWDEDGMFHLLPGETHVYEGRPFYLNKRMPFSEEMRFTISVYLGKGFWLDSEPLTCHGVTPDLKETIGIIKDNKTKNSRNTRELVAITYKNERWLYIMSVSGSGCYPVCPLSHKNEIRVEPHDDGGLFKIWDGNKAMILDMYKMMLLDGPDENNVFGKWTRERKQKAEADNAEVRRKKAEQQ